MTNRITKRNKLRSIFKDLTNYANKEHSNVQNCTTAEAMIERAKLAAVNIDLRIESIINSLIPIQPKIPKLVDGKIMKIKQSTFN